VARDGDGCEDGRGEAERRARACTLLCPTAHCGRERTHRLRTHALYAGSQHTTHDAPRGGCAAARAPPPPPPRRPAAPPHRRARTRCRTPRRSQASCRRPRRRRRPRWMGAPAHHATRQKGTRAGEHQFYSCTGTLPVGHEMKGERVLASTRLPLRQHQRYIEILIGE
jgi:hypothetical protein